MPTTKQLPQTSLDAHKRARPMIQAHHQKIVTALYILDEATYEEIANHLRLDRHAVGRRLCEMQREGIVMKPGTTRRTSSGRNAFVYKLIAPIQEKREQENNKFWDDLQSDKLEPKQFQQTKLF